MTPKGAPAIKAPQRIEMTPWIVDRGAVGIRADQALIVAQLHHPARRAHRADVPRAGAPSIGRAVQWVGVRQRRVGEDQRPTGGGAKAGKIHVLVGEVGEPPWQHVASDRSGPHVGRATHLLDPSDLRAVGEAHEGGAGREGDVGVDGDRHHM